MKKNFLRLTMLCMAVSASFTATRGENAPILLSYDELYANAANLPILNYESVSRADAFALATSKYQAAPISPALYDYNSDPDMEEGQVFYLEGGKTYYLDGNNELSKGLTLATRPEDVADGKRARVICGIGEHEAIWYGSQWNYTYSFFMLGSADIDGVAEVNMEKLAFCDIDFDNPEAVNHGDYMEGLGYSTGNYFINMYSNGMPITLESLVMENCTFKRLVRGFIREQGAHRKIWNHVLIKNNLFYDCGYYNQGAGGYPWIAGSGSNSDSNLYKDMQVIENTFYDSPFPSFFEETTSINRTAGPWNITFSNNTLINFNTRADGSIFKMRYLPDGSVYNVENNLIVLTKQAGDQRPLEMYGADIRETLGHVTLNFNNNWSTNDNLTNGQIFSSKAWTATSLSFYKLVRDGNATLNGTLEVNVADVSSTDLMVSPCPPHKAVTSTDRNMHRADALDGTATTEYNVNLYFKDMDNDIYKNNVGAARWRTEPSTGISSVIQQTPNSDAIYTLSGHRVTGSLRPGIYIQNGRKVIK